MSKRISIIDEYYNFITHRGRHVKNATIIRLKSRSILFFRFEKVVIKRLLSTLIINFIMASDIIIRLQSKSHRRKLYVLQTLLIYRKAVIVPSKSL